MANWTGTDSLQSIPAGSTATTTVAAVLDNGETKSVHTMICTNTNATFTTGAAQLQVSHDNTNWLNAGSAVTLTTNTVQASTQTVAARYVRAVISTAITGGGTTGITVASA